MFIRYLALGETLKSLSSKVDLFSREFVFGIDQGCIRSRNQVIAQGRNGPITLLSEMLRYGLDDTRRANLFFSPYHLGSSKSIPTARLTLVELARKVRREKHDALSRADRSLVQLNDDPESLKKEFESITSALKAITGRRFGDYEDKQNAIRVIYLIDRMMADPNVTMEGRGIRLLTFMKTPTNKFSFEARDSHPTADSERNTFLLNDLKSYVGLEIDNDVKDRIDSVFYSLIERVDLIRSNLDAAAYSSGHAPCIMDDYRSIHSAVEAIDVGSDVKPDREPARLDLDLYLHLNRFEFQHFAGAYAEILEKAIPPSPISPIRNEIVAALSVLTSKSHTYIDTTLDNYSLKDFHDIARENAHLFRDLTTRSLGLRLTDTEYEQSILLTYELLYRLKLFGLGEPIPRDAVSISFRNIVSSLCAIAQAIKHRTTFRPRVYGDDTQSRSIITPLESAVDLADTAPRREIAEGYLQLWHVRREWVQDALEGNAEIAELKFSLRKLLLSKVVECVRPNDIVKIEQALTAFETRLLSAGSASLGT